jgi:hypothetical protein
LEIESMPQLSAAQTKRIEEALAAAAAQGASPARLTEIRVSLTAEFLALKEVVKQQAAVAK